MLSYPESALMQPPSVPQNALRGPDHTPHVIRSTRFPSCGSLAWRLRQTQCGRMFPDCVSTGAISSGGPVPPTGALVAASVLFFLNSLPLSLGSRFACSFLQTGSGVGQRCARHRGLPEPCAPVPVHNTLCHGVRCASTVPTHGWAMHFTWENPECAHRVSASWTLRPGTTPGAESGFPLASFIPM